MKYNNDVAFTSTEKKNGRHFFSVSSSERKRNYIFLRLLFYLKQRETKENLVSSLLNFFLLSVFPEKSPDYHFPEVAASQVNLLYVHFAS